MYICVFYLWTDSIIIRWHYFFIKSIKKTLFKSNSWKPDVCLIYNTDVVILVISLNIEFSCLFPMHGLHQLSCCFSHTVNDWFKHMSQVLIWLFFFLLWPVFIHRANNKTIVTYMGLFLLKTQSSYPFHNKICPWWKRPYILAKK